MNAVVACLLLLNAGCFATPVEVEQQNEPTEKKQHLPLSRRKLDQLEGSIKTFAGPDYSTDNFSKPAQLFFWKVSKMAEIEDEYEWIQRKLPSLAEESEHEFLDSLNQHILLAFTQLSRETQSELEAAMPWLKELQALIGFLRTPPCGCPDGPSSSKLQALPSTPDRPTGSSTEIPHSTIPQPAASRSLECDLTWTLFGRKCFKLGSSNTFAAGLRACQVLGATVASVHSKDENTFLAKLANDTLGRREPYYIGFQRTSDDWQWVDGSVADFVYWAEGEPNGHKHGEQCTEVWGGGVDHAWNYLKCSTRLPIVCQKNVYGVGVLEPE